MTRPLTRLVVVGFSPSAGWLVRSAVRFVGDLTVLLAVSARGDARSTLHDRMTRLGLGLDALPPPEGAVVTLEDGGRVRVVAHAGADLASFALSHMGQGAPFDAAVFLADPDSGDADARTHLRVLRFCRGLAAGKAPLGPRLRLIVEFADASRGAQLERELDAVGVRRSSAVELTVLSTEHIRNYFMVHSAFVPGVTEFYETLLDARGQEFIRFEVDPARIGAADGQVTLPELAAQLAPAGIIPIALEFSNGSIRVHPRVDERFEVQTLRAVFAMADLDGLAHTDGSVRPSRSA